MILVVSHPGDDHLAPVVAELRRLGDDPTVVDLADFPSRLAVSLGCGGSERRELVRPGGRRVDLDAVRSVWWRRPRHPVLDPAVADPDQASWAWNECQEALAGLWDSLDATWVNPPRATEAAAMKTHNLRAAAACGLAVPRTLVTSSPADARAFVDALGTGRVVAKAFSATEACWRETRVVGAAERAVLDAVRYAPVIFQEFVPAEVDLRVTVVGEEIFAAAVHSAELAYPVDFRVELDAVRMTPTTLPAGVRIRLLRLMRRLGLVYGAVDLRRTPAGRHVYLEVNPAGQWLFVEEKTGLPITAAVARALTAATESRAQAS